MEKGGIMPKREAIYFLLIHPNGDFLVVNNGIKHDLPGGLIDTDQSPRILFRTCFRLDREESDFAHLATLQMRINALTYCDAKIYKLNLRHEEVKFFRKCEWLDESVRNKLMHDEIVHVSKITPVLRQAIESQVGAGP